MRTIRFLLEKEFRQIFRNRSIVAMMTFAPMMQLIILPLAADYEVKNVALAVVDHAHSGYSQKLVSKLAASHYFRLIGNEQSFQAAFQLLEQDKADLVLEIPSDFDPTLIRENAQKVFLAVNAINGVKANVGGAYLRQILGQFNADLRMEWRQPDRFQQLPTIDVVSSNWFNPMMNYKFYMVPGILAVLVTIVGGYMSSLNIVKEKEIGTIEQINVTPIKKHHFILGKLIPFWIIGMGVFTFGLFVIAFLVYGIVPLGSIATLYLFLAVYLMAVLGFGLLVSTYSDTQQQAMSIAFFFIMIFMLMSGLFTPIDSMPEWAKWIARFNPVSYFIEVMRMIVLKGSGFGDVRLHLAIVAMFALVLNGWAVLNYKKTS